MSSSRSQTPSPRISPLPRLESYASYSSTPDRLWEGHDPVRLAAREAGIRARMVARARARTSGGSEGNDRNEGGSETLMDEYGRLEGDSASIGRTSPLSPTTPTAKSPLKPLILASSSTLPPLGQQPVPSSITTPRSVSTSGRRTITRRPSAVELKYSPISSPQTPISISFVAERGKERQASSPRISMSPQNRLSDTWSYRSSSYLSPSPSSFSTSPHLPRSPVSPNLLSPSYASSTSPTSAFFGSSKPRRAPVPPSSPDLWDDEEQWKRVSTYLVDPYGPSDVSPAESLRRVGPVGKDQRDAAAGGRAMGMADLRIPLNLDDALDPVSKQRANRRMPRRSNESSSSPRQHAPGTSHPSATSPSATGADHAQETPLDSPQDTSHQKKNVSPARDARPTSISGSTASVQLWEALPPLPVEPPRKSVLLERARSKGGKIVAGGLQALGLTEEGFDREQPLPGENEIENESPVHLTQTNTEQTDSVRRRDLPIMAKMSIMEERLRRIGQKWSGTTSKAGVEEPRTHSRIGSSTDNTGSDRAVDTLDSRVTSISSLAEVALEMAFPTPPVRTAPSSSTSPTIHSNGRNVLLGEPSDPTNHAIFDRRPSSSSTMTVVSDQEPTTFAKKDKYVTKYNEGKADGWSSPLLRPASRKTICLGSPPLSTADDCLARGKPPPGPYASINSTSAVAPMTDTQNNLEREESPCNTPLLIISAEQHQEQSLQPTTPRINAASDPVPQRATEKTHDWLVPPMEDIADWGELEIIGRSR